MDYMSRSGHEWTSTIYQIRAFYDLTSSGIAFLRPARSSTDVFQSDVEGSSYLVALGPL